MNKYDIIEQLAKKDTIKKIIKKTGIDARDIDDLQQDILISLLEKDEEFLVDLYERG